MISEMKLFVSLLFWAQYFGASRLNHLYQGDTAEDCIFLLLTLMLGWVLYTMYHMLIFTLIVDLMALETGAVFG